MLYEWACPSFEKLLTYAGISVINSAHSFLCPNLPAVRTVCSCTNDLLKSISVRYCRYRLQRLRPVLQPPPKLPAGIFSPEFEDFVDKWWVCSVTDTSFAMVDVSSRRTTLLHYYYSLRKDPRERNDLYFYKVRGFLSLLPSCSLSIKPDLLPSFEIGI